MRSHPPAGGLFFSIRFSCEYNGTMMNEEYNAPNSGCCGRKFPTAKPDCNFNDCYLSETYGCALGCIKKDADPCKAKAVIPAITVDTTEGITNLANCFVHVISINTTFYIDDKHRPMIVWAGPVEVAVYDIENNPLNLRGQTCYTTYNGEYSEVYFDKQGVGHVLATELEEA